MIALAVALGGAIGAPTRFLTDLLIQSRHSSRMPWGTFAVNVVGSFVLGFVAGGHPTAQWSAFLATGFCGGLTTFSTFSFETVRLAESGAWRTALTNVALSLTLGLAAVWLGWWLA